MENKRVRKYRKYVRHTILPIITILFALATIPMLTVLAEEEATQSQDELLPEETQADPSQEPEALPMAPELTEAMYEEAVIAEAEDAEQTGDISESEIPLASLPHTGLDDTKPAMPPVLLYLLALIPLAGCLLPKALNP